jgi:REP element-mobilizing transposase RayT
VDRRRVLLDEEREDFVRLMRAYESFCQVRIVSYCIMSNHFHLMVEVKKRPEGVGFSDVWLLKQARFIYSKAAVAMLKAHLESLRQQGDDGAAEVTSYVDSLFNR